MKNLLYAITMTLLLIAMGCKSVQKMVDKGEYDKAIEYSTKKLAGEKNKKTKYVKALERAFGKVMNEDLDRLDYLARKNQPSQWVERYDILMDIDARQRKIEPYLPLISEEGYRARFDMIDVAPRLVTAGEGAAEYHYQIAQDALVVARRGDHKAAKNAYAELERIERYHDTYKDRYTLMEEAHELGTMDVLIEVEDDVLRALGVRQWDAERQVRDIRDEFWVRYHTDERRGVEYDVHMQLRYRDMYETPEREYVDRFENTLTKEKEVDRRDDSGNIVKDSTGTVLKDIVTEKYVAAITDVTRTKGLKLICDALYIDRQTGRTIDDEELEVILDFESKAFTYTGDEEALPDRVLPRKDEVLEPFPTDWEMSRDAMEQMSELFLRFVKRQRLDR